MTTVLLVEDNTQVRVSMVKSFTMAGIGVIEAADGEEALSLIDRGGYDLIITDLWMPKVDGIALLKHLATHRPETKVIAISGGAPGRAPIEFSAALAQTYGADAVFHKPFDNDDLIDVVNRLVSVDPSAVGGTGKVATNSGVAQLP